MGCQGHVHILVFMNSMYSMDICHESFEWLTNMLIGTNLSRDEMLVIVDIGFQLQQRDVLQPHRMLSTIAILLILWYYFCVPPNQDTHPTSSFGKTMHCNLATSRANHKNNWKVLDSWMVIMWLAITAIPYIGFGVLINIISKEDIAYCVTIGDIPYCICLDFTKMSS